MKRKLSFKVLSVLCSLIVTSFLTAIQAQETVTVWVLPGGTYNAENLDLQTYSVSTTCATFGGSDYNNAVSEITGGRASQTFKFGGGVFEMPVGYKATELTVYGWSRYGGRSPYVRNITVNGKVVATFSEGTSPYRFPDCGANPNSTNRTKDNCTIYKINEISDENPAESFMIDLSAETHAFCKIVLKSESGFKQVIAFPGAEGHGRYTTGGRGGRVVKVTNLDDNASGQSMITGSLRWALDQPSPKTIVFEVSGTIHLKQGLGTQRDNVTIAGQTSPGGICIADYGFTINSNNVIIRFLRFRPGDASGGEPDGLGGMDKSNIIVDHCSVSWSVDECLSVYGMENSTVQWCIASEPLRLSTHVKSTHCYGGNWGGNKASYHHNLIAHSESRTPRLGPRPSTQMNEYVDIRNNVFYNWAGNGCYGGEGMKVNMVNNYYKPGPATDNASSKVKYRIAGIGIRTTEYVTNPDGTPNAWKPMEHVWGKFYIDGNKVEGNSGVTNDNWTNGVYAQTTNGSGVDNTYTQATRDTMRLSEPLDAGYVTTHTPDMAYERVLDYVGASLYRDDVDTRIVSDVRQRKASFTGSGNKSGFINTPMDTKPAGAPSDWTPWLQPSQMEPPKDSNNDGIADDWFAEHVPSGETASSMDAEGYTYLEVYINSLVQDIIEMQNEGGTGTGVSGSKVESSVYAYSENNTLYLNNLPDCYVEIYTISGMLAAKKKVSEGEKETSFDLPSGVYIVRVISNNNSESFKTIVR